MAYTPRSPGLRCSPPRWPELRVRVRATAWARARAWVRSRVRARARVRARPRVRLEVRVRVIG